MSDPRTPPRSPRRNVSHGGGPLHVPVTPSRLREAVARSPDDRFTAVDHEQDDNYPEGQSPPPLPSSPHSRPTTTESEPFHAHEDDQATGTMVEPTSQDEDERTALLENYHFHSRVCGLRNCNHGTFSPRAASFVSTTNQSYAESSFGRGQSFVGEHEQAGGFFQAILGTPVGDAITGKKSRNTSKYLAQKHGIKNTRLMYVSYYLPCIKWISQYQWAWFKGDFLAALTMASFYIPMSLSYATNLGHVPPLNGLYAFVINPLVYALLGSCPQMAVGPEAPGSLLIGSIVMTSIKQGSAPDKDNDAVHSEIAGVATATAGLIIFVAGVTRLGFLDGILSRPFLRGFISAIGFVIFIDQAIPELGLSPYVADDPLGSGSPVQKIIFIFKHIKSTHKLTAIVGWTSFAIIMVTRELKNRLQPRFPGAAYFPDRFIVVVVSTILSWKLHWADHGLERLGTVKAPGKGLLSFHWPFRFEHMEHIDTALSTSLIIALLGFFESSVAAKSLGDGTSGLKGMSASPNRELIALGTANLVGGCFMALPAFGGYGRSKVNVSTGGTTPMSSALLSLFSILCVFFALPFFVNIPKCVLSAMISVVAYSLIEEAPHDIKFFIQIRGWSELALMTLVWLATLFYSLTVGIALGMGLSLLQIVRHATKPRIQILGRVPGAPHKFENAESFADTVEDVDGCMIVKIPEPLTFANTGALKDRLRRLEKYGTDKAHPSLPRVRTEDSNKNVIFDVHGVTSIDGSGAQVMTEIVQGYVSRGARVVFCRLPRKRSKVYEMFEKSGIVDLCGKNRFVGSIEEALKLAEEEDMSSYFSAHMDSHAA